MSRSERQARSAIPSVTLITKSCDDGDGIRITYDGILPAIWTCLSMMQDPNR